MGGIDPLAAARLEIVELHRFFEGWLGGALSADESSFARLTSALAEDFEMVGPDGRLIVRAVLLEELRGAAGLQPGLRIWTEGESPRVVGEGLVLATYREWQSLPDGEPRARASTVLLRVRAEAPGGLEWLHVHETWHSNRSAPKYGD